MERTSHFLKNLLESFPTTYLFKLSHNYVILTGYKFKGAL